MQNKQSSTDIHTLTRIAQQYDIVQFDTQLLHSLLTIMQDGISLLSANLEVLYVNPAMYFWYEADIRTPGIKCYEAYHGRKEPCKNCTTLTCIETKQVTIGDHVYHKTSKKEGWQQIISVPLLNRDGEVALVMEYVQDMTAGKKAALSLELMKAQLENMISSMRDSEQVNQIRQKNMLTGINKSIEAALSYLSNILDENTYEMISELLSLENIGIRQEHAALAKLSEKELTVARYIAKGYLSKEIADKLMVSKKTVDFHRANIRKKLELLPDQNLSSRLRELLGEK